MVALLRWLVGGSAPPLRHGRVILREPAPEHYKAWAALRHQSRRHLEPYEPTWTEDELTRRGYRRRLRRYRLDRRRGSGAAFFVFSTPSNALVGGVTLTNIRYGVTLSGTVGYWIGLPYVRQGYASQALAGLLKHAFEDLELNRIEAACMPRNLASIAVLEGAGFRREGLARRYLRIHGQFEDHLLFARLRDDDLEVGSVATGDAAQLRLGSPSAGALAPQGGGYPSGDWPSEPTHGERGAGSREEGRAA